MDALGEASHRRLHRRTRPEQNAQSTARLAFPGREQCGAPPGLTANLLLLALEEQERLEGRRSVHPSDALWLRDSNLQPPSPHRASKALPLPGHAAAANQSERLAPRPLVDRMTFRRRPPAGPRETASCAHAPVSSGPLLSPGRFWAPMPARGKLSHLQLAHWSALSWCPNCVCKVACVGCCCRTPGWVDTGVLVKFAG